MLIKTRLPKDKLQKASDLVKKALQKTFICKDNLDHLLGFLSFCAKVVVPGRAFLRRLFNIKTSNLSKTSNIHLNQDIKADLLWWHHFLPKWNGIRILRPKRDILWMWTDASGSCGMGDYVLQEWQSLKSLPVEQAFSEQFTTCMSHKRINAKEMTAFLHALQYWLPLCKGCHLIIHCDNFVVSRGIANLSMRGQAIEPAESRRAIHSPFIMIIESFACALHSTKKSVD